MFKGLKNCIGCSALLFVISIAILMLKYNAGREAVCDEASIGTLSDTTFSVPCSLFMGRYMVPSDSVAAWVIRPTRPTVRLSATNDTLTINTKLIKVIVLE